MSLEELKKQILEMDVKSDEFWDLYKCINEKYWTFEKPDHWQEAGRMINAWLMKGEPEEHIVVASIVKKVFFMRKEKRKACTGTLGFKDETFHFDIYTTEVEKDKMGEMIASAHAALKKKAKKSQFGKKYF